MALFLNNPAAVRVSNDPSQPNPDTISAEATTVSASAIVGDPAAPSGDPVADAIAAAEAEAAAQDAAAGILPNGELTDEQLTASFLKEAQYQQTYADQRKQSNNGDWRVRLSLAENSDYLYNVSPVGGAGILEPLRYTKGVIFPYTPQISTSYRANYDPYDLVHSNYRGYFYKNSYVEAVNLNATFTAQDTDQANYLLAVIHFFRSATKMFYGQDAQRGSPPPLVFLSGLGEFQFNKHPCLIQNFSYNLPADVDYIRAGSPNNSGLDLTTRRQRQDVATNSIFGQVQRMAAAFTTKGAIPQRAPQPNLALNSPTYVPTKMEIQLQLLPVQSRQQVSKEFSLKNFANGNQLKGGFW